MNLILLFAEDFVDEETVRLSGRRLEHVLRVHRAAVGQTLVVGLAGDRIGTGEVARLDPEALVMRVQLHRDPPPPLDVTLLLALPRPKVLNRVLASVTSMGVKRIVLMNAWRVEKSYWKSPRLSDENLLLQRILGLEQARDTILPSIEIQRFFRPFVESLEVSGLSLVAHPGGREPYPRELTGPLTLAVGPEGGFIEEEIASFERKGFRIVTMGERILRVETAVAALLAPFRFAQS
jgi:RsmE family RNA methyltransferase